jgi:hypothetical protein
MIIDVGQLGEFVQVTAAFSNAVVAAVMPHISDFSTKLELPIHQPIAMTNVVRCGVLPTRDPAMTVGFKGGWNFSFRNGYVSGFEGPHSYIGLQAPEQAYKFYGDLKISKNEAIALARTGIRKLGIPLEAVFAEQEPAVRGPFTVETANGVKTVPHYIVVWTDPRDVDESQSYSVQVEINGSTTQIERLDVSNKNLDRSPPFIAVTPPPAKDNWPQANLEYARLLLPVVLLEVDKYATRLSLPIKSKFTTNQVERFYLCDNGGWPHSELTFTNGWRFVYRNSVVNGYYAPDVFFSSSQKGILIKDYIGKWNMTESDAIAMARKEIKKFNCPTNLFHVDGPPDSVIRPHTTGATVIPRFLISWDKLNQNHDDLLATACVEIDADKKIVKSAYFDHKSFWGHGPNLGVPISVAHGPTSPPRGSTK